MTNKSTPIESAVKEIAPYIPNVLGTAPIAAAHAANAAVKSYLQHYLDAPEVLSEAVKETATVHVVNFDAAAQEKMGAIVMQLTNPNEVAKSILNAMMGDLDG